MPLAPAAKCPIRPGWQEVSLTAVPEKPTVHRRMRFGPAVPAGFHRPLRHAKPLPEAAARAPLPLIRALGKRRGHKAPLASPATAFPQHRQGRWRRSLLHERARLEPARRGTARGHHSPRHGAARARVARRKAIRLQKVPLPLRGLQQVKPPAPPASRPTRHACTCGNAPCVRVVQSPGPDCSERHRMDRR